MNVKSVKKLIGAIVFVLSFAATGTCFAYWHGYYHGGYYHGGYYHGGYYHGGWHGGYYHGGYWGPGAVVGVPYGGYYPSGCQTIRVCNSYGHCWYQDSCN